MILLGTTSGRVLKVINAKSADSKEDVKTVVIEELQVFSPGINVKELKVRIMSCEIKYKQEV